MAGGVGADGGASTGRLSKSSSDSGVRGSSIAGGADATGAAAAMGCAGGAITGGATSGASGADDSGDAAATRATNAAIAPVLLVPVEGGGDELAAPCARVELPASGAEAGERVDVEAAPIDELPGAVGRGGAFAAGGGEAAGAGRAGGTVGIADLGIGLLAVAARALVLLLGAVGLEADGFLTVDEAEVGDTDVAEADVADADVGDADVGDADEADGVPAGDVGCFPVDDADCVLADGAGAAGFVTAAGRAGDPEVAVALAGRAIGAVEPGRVTDVGVLAGAAADDLAAVVDAAASGEAAAAADLPAIVLGCALAPDRAGPALADCPVVGEVASDAAAAGDLAAVPPGCVPVPDRADAPTPGGAVGVGSEYPDVAESLGVSDSASETAVTADDLAAAASSEAVAPNLAAAVPGCAPALVVVGEAASDELAAAVAGLRVLGRADAASVADEVGSSDAAAVGFGVADAVLVAETLLVTDEPAGADVGSEDGVPVEVGAAGGGAIQIPDSDASKVGCAQDPEVEPVFAGAMAAGREPESEVDELAAFEPESGVAVDTPGVAAVLPVAVEVETFDAAPTAGGIPKPAGEVGFAGAGAPPPAESVSKGPSGSNN